MSALLLLRAVAAAGLLAVTDTLGVQRTADDLVAHTRQVLHTTTADEHHGVLLKVVAHARNVSGHLNTIGEPHARHLTKRRVRLLRRGRVHAGADAAALRATLERRCLGLTYLVLAALADQLLNRGHRVSVRALAGVSSWSCVAGSAGVLTCCFSSRSDPRGRACRAPSCTHPARAEEWGEVTQRPLPSACMRAHEATGTKGKTTQRTAARQ